MGQVFTVAFGTALSLVVGQRVAAVDWGALLLGAFFLLDAGYWFATGEFLVPI